MDRSDRSLQPGPTESMGSRLLLVANALLGVLVIVAFAVAIAAYVKARDADNAAKSSGSSPAPSPAATGGVRAVISTSSLPTGIAPNKLVSFSGGNLQLGSGTTFYRKSRLAVNTEVTTPDIIALYGGRTLVVASDAAMYLGTLSDNDDITWSDLLPSHGFTNIDGIERLSDTAFVVLAGGTLRAASLAATGALAWGAPFVYFNGSTFDPHMDAVDATRIALSYYDSSLGYDKTVIQTRVCAVAADNSIACGPNTPYSVNHIVHDVVALNATAYLLLYPLDNISASFSNDPWGRLSGRVATVDSLNRVTLYPEASIAFPSLLAYFFDSDRLADGTVAVAFPDVVLGSGLRVVLLTTADTADGPVLDSTSALVLNEGDRGGLLPAGYYAYMRVTALDSARFLVSYANFAEGGALTSVVLAAIPGVGLARLSSEFVLSPALPNLVDSYLWITSAPVASDKFVVLYSFTVFGSGVPAPTFSGATPFIGYLRAPLLGIVDSVADGTVSVQTTGVVTFASGGLVRGAVYYGDKSGALVMGGAATFADWVPEQVSGDGYLTTADALYESRVGVALSATQLLLLAA